MRLCVSIQMQCNDHCLCTPLFFWGGGAKSPVLGKTEAFWIIFGAGFAALKLVLQEEQALHREMQLSSHPLNMCQN